MTGRPPAKEREAARPYLTNLNVIQKDIIDKSDLLRFYTNVQTSHPKFTQPTPQWTRMLHTVISIPHS